MNLGDRKVNWVSYFSVNNIELDILLNTVDIAVRNRRACSIKDYSERTVFEKLNPSLVEKLRSKGVLKSFVKRGEPYYTLTTRGIKAFIEVSSPVFMAVYRNPGLDYREVARIVGKHALYGGVHKVYAIHEKLVKRILGVLSYTGFLERRENRFYPSDDGRRVQAAIGFLSKIASISFIRNMSNVVQFLMRAYRIPLNRMQEISEGILYKCAFTSEREPDKAIFELLVSIKARVDEYTRHGRLLDAVAYACLSLHLVDTVVRSGREDENIKGLRERLEVDVYKLLGDYFYNNLSFDTAIMFYRKAIEHAEEKRELGEALQKIKAKYMLSRARSLASHRKYNEAIAELDRLIEYYRSTGMIREAEIAQALKKEYLGEIEVLRGKSCIAHGLFEEAAAIYNRLGPRYSSKSLAAHCKALISRGECELLVNKNPVEALKTLREASDIASKILSPHLRNAALSLYYEAKARIDVDNGDLVVASSDFNEAAKYYSARGLIKRALLSRARSLKFRGFHNILHDNFRKALDNFESSCKSYLDLLKMIDKQLYSRGRTNPYLLGEALKGVLDTKAIIELINGLIEIENTIIVSPATIEKLIAVIDSANHYLSEADRTKEYILLQKLKDLLRELKEKPGIRSLENKIIMINNMIDDIQKNYIDSGREPRKESIAKTVLAILTRIKYGLEAITRYIEEV